jgi:hypothetical protein
LKHDPAVHKYDKMATTDMFKNSDAHERKMLSSAYNAISSVEGGWNFLKTYEPPEEEGFMFVKTPPVKMNEIEKAVIDADSGHSGSSYGWTMRQMQYIAKNGLDAFNALHESKDLKKKLQLLEEENARLRASLAAPKKDLTREEKILLEEYSETNTAHPLTAALSNLGTLAENLSTAGVTQPTLLDIAEASRGIPGFEGQADAMTRFAQGKMSYAEMRSLCG